MRIWRIFQHFSFLWLIRGSIMTSQRSLLIFIVKVEWNLPLLPWLFWKSLLIIHLKIISSILPIIDLSILIFLLFIFLISIIILLIHMWFILVPMVHLIPWFFTSVVANSSLISILLLNLLVLHSFTLFDEPSRVIQEVGVLLIWISVAITIIFRVLVLTHKGSWFWNWYTLSMIQRLLLFHQGIVIDFIICFTRLINWFAHEFICINDRL